ncbi:hypothetical protein WICPIJ_004025 [Wickerhamomyces pijperi]|uniref:Uncharacterized protein n=1 Tax=Wickerhamomyces pijperi TaxID=599730 RepID=A0A9P8TMF7_WICPI|nr:hypothetical protein WICPIJ_004025 [Wickerhamomyces pijperi]
MTPWPSLIHQDIKSAVESMIKDWAGLMSPVKGSTCAHTSNGSWTMIVMMSELKISGVANIWSSLAVLLGVESTGSGVNLCLLYNSEHCLVLMSSWRLYWLFDSAALFGGVCSIAA